MSRTVLIGLIVVGVLVLVLFLRRRVMAATIPYQAPRPQPRSFAIGPVPQPGQQPPPLATAAPAPAPRPSLVSTGLNAYQAGCTAVAAAKGVPPAISQFGCDPKSNLVLQANIKAGQAIVSGTKTVFGALGIRL